MQWNPSDLKVENVVTGSIAKVAQDRHGIIARSVSAAAGSFVVLLPVRSRHSLTTVQVGQAKGICRRVEEERGAGPTGSRPFPFPAHQTGRALFEHPAFRQNSPSAHGRFDHEKTQYTKFPEHNSVRVPGSA
jgi:hypothetical protein